MDTIRDAFRKVAGAVMKANPKGRPIDKDGKIYLDPTPIAPPLGYNRPKPMYETIREMVRAEATRLAAQTGVETFEDADDFLHVLLTVSVMRSRPLEQHAPRLFSGGQRAGPIG